MKEYLIFLKASLRAPVSRAMLIISIILLFSLPYYIAFFSVEHKSMSLFKTYFSFPLVFNSVGIFQFYPSILFGAVVVLIITKAYEEGIFKILLINGYTRSKLWLNSVLICFIVSFILFVVTTIISFHIGYLKTRNFDEVYFKDFEWILIYFFQTYLILLYALVVSLLIKHSGSGVFVYLIYFILVERLLAQLMDFVFNLYPAFRFLPGKVVEDLTYMQPNPDFVAQYLEVQEERWIASVIWLIISLVATKILFKKSNYSR